MEILSVLEKSPEKWKLNFSRSALFHMKSKAGLKYFVNDWCFETIWVMDSRDDRRDR